MRRFALEPLLRAGLIAGSVMLGLLPGYAHGQITPEAAKQIQNVIGEQADALTILGGDFGLASGNFKSTGTFKFEGNTDASLGLTKIGGTGEIGDPEPLGTLDIGFQPRLQGNIGFLDSTNYLHSPLLQGDISRLSGHEVEFGGGGRFWLTDRLSVAPTALALYGYMSNSYTANSTYMLMNLPRAKELGLVDWNVNTLTLVTSLNVQYLISLNRAIITLSSEPIFFHTATLTSSNENLNVNGDAGSLVDKIDLDVPLGKELFGHELRTGGYISRTDLFGDLRSGLDVPYLYELHGRLVLDFLGQLWKLQWLGIGASYLRGPNISGWEVGADASFRF